MGAPLPPAYQWVKVLILRGLFWRVSKWPHFLTDSNRLMDGCTRIDTVCVFAAANCAEWAQRVVQTGVFCSGYAPFVSCIVFPPTLSRS